MPHWNCERCGARLYSASKSLMRQACPVCQGRLAPQREVPPESSRQPTVGPLRGAQSSLTLNDL